MRIIAIVLLAASVFLSCFLDPSDDSSNESVRPTLETESPYGEWTISPSGSIRIHLPPDGDENSVLSLSCSPYDDDRPVFLTVWHPSKEGERESVAFGYTVDGAEYLWRTETKSLVGGGRSLMEFEQSDAIFELLKMVDGPMFLELGQEDTKRRVAFDVTGYANALAWLEQHPDCWTSRPFRMN